MPLTSHGGRRWPPPLGDRVQDLADAEQVADAIIAIWKEIDQSLHPIIGHGGVAAIHNRSLTLTAAAYPWLAIGHEGLLAAMDFEALRAALAQRSAEEAAAGGTALFRSFRELLATLVGAPLTDRLLGSVWAPSSGGSPAQDESP